MYSDTGYRDEVVRFKSVGRYNMTHLESLGWEESTAMLSVEILGGYKVTVYTDKFSFKDESSTLSESNPDVSHNTLYVMRSCEITEIPPSPPPFPPEYFIAIMYSDDGYHGREVLKFPSIGKYDMAALESLGWKEHTAMLSVMLLNGYKVTVYTDKFSFEDESATLVKSNPDVPHNTLYVMRSCEISKMDNSSTDISPDQGVHVLDGYVTVSEYANVTLV